jgi:hypothetical protein
MNSAYFPDTVSYSRLRSLGRKSPPLAMKTVPLGTFSGVVMAGTSAHVDVDAIVKLPVPSSGGCFSTATASAGVADDQRRRRLGFARAGRSGRRCTRRRRLGRQRARRE